MRVLLVSPAPFGGGPERSGGVVGYVGDLASAMSSAGVSVGVVSGGHVYRPGFLGRGVGSCGVEELEPFGGVRRFSVVNSPVLAPALWQFGGPESEASCGAVESAFGDVCGQFEPDVVHVHGFEGLSAGIVSAAKGRGASVVVSVHNYHAFCPQVYLMQGRREPCIDDRGGLACEGCESAIDMTGERRRRAADGAGGPTIAPPPLPPVQTFDDAGEPTDATLGLWMDGHPMWRANDGVLPLGASGDGGRAGSAGRYGARRSAFVGALNASDAVLGVSEASAAIAVRMGVDRSIVRVMPIGSWAAGSASRPLPPGRGEVLRLAFLGFNNYYKGLPMLVDALGLLSPAYRSRIHLSAYGTGMGSIAGRLRALVGLGGYEIGGAYGRTDVVRLLSGVDAGVVPSVWHDNGPQTAIEMRALGVPVIGARIGGIPDIVREGVDGLLFRSNDRGDLARVIAMCLRKPDLLRAIRGTVGGWHTMSEHAGRLVDVYERALSSRMVSSGREHR
ncbi:MAG: glycosyltransferase [Planctomycetota bacterium]